MQAQESPWVGPCQGAAQGQPSVGPPGLWLAQSLPQEPPLGLSSSRGQQPVHICAHLCLLGSSGLVQLQAQWVPPALTPQGRQLTLAPSAWTKQERVSITTWDPFPISPAHSMVCYAFLLYEGLISFPLLSVCQFFPTAWLMTIFSLRKVQYQ